MCGIFGLTMARPLASADIAAGAAIGALAHRGPDGEGAWHDSQAGILLAHRRLAIIDLDPRAAQPMAAFGLRIVFNGEIYNYRALREQLAGLGHRFSTESDTEVLLAGWRQWGEGVLDRLDGMFAFALFDGRDLFLAVDPFGEKPLFLQQVADGFRFASEVAALQAAGPLQSALDRDDLYGFLSLGYVPRGRTGYEGLERLGPGTIVTIRDGRIVKRRRYWTIPDYRVGFGAPQPLSEQDINRVRDALTRAIEARLVSDVPLALFLSSGVDSTLVALLCRYELGIKPHTLTIAFKGRLSGSLEVDESPIANKLAALIGSDHIVHSLEAGATGYTIDDLVSLFGLPFDNSGALAVKALCALARRSVTVGVTGLGGDELSFGYGKTANLYRLRAYHRLPFMFQQLSGAAARALAPMVPRATALAARAGATPHQTYLAEKNFPAIGLLNTLPGFRAWAAQIFSADKLPFVAAGQWDLSETLPQSLLLAQDHASMSESMELRTPFLSRELAGVMASFDPRSLIQFGRKNVFRRLRDRYLQGVDLGTRKHGFLFSTDQLLRDYGSAAPAVDELPKRFVSTIWDRRFDGEGWTRLALRLAIYERWKSRPAQARPAALSAAG